jgi:hypothetical protein
MACGRLFRIFDSMMMDAVENLIETLCDLVEVPEGQLTFIELAVQENLVNDSLHESLDTRGRRVLKRPRCRLHPIGEQNEAGLLGLGLGARVSEVIDTDGVLALEFLGFFAEIGDQTGSVVLLNDINDGFAEPVVLGDFHAVLHMGCYD